MRLQLGLAARRRSRRTSRRRSGARGRPRPPRPAAASRAGSRSDSSRDWPPAARRGCARGSPRDRPYTASRTSSGAACFILYQRSHSARSCMRKSADRSMMRAPASSSARASLMATPFGVAKNTTSQPRSASRVGLGERQLDAPAQAREHRRHRRARLLARGDRLQLDLRMLREQPQQLDARVPRSADDARLDHCRFSSKNKKPPGGGFRFAELPDASINVSSTACAAAPCAGRPSFARLRARRASPARPRSAAASAPHHTRSARA